MAATSLAEQLAEIPLLEYARPTSPGGSCVISTMLGWLQKGVKAAFCGYSGNTRMVFLGEGGNLFELEHPRRLAAEASALVELPTPKEIFHGSEVWKLPDEPDLSAVCVRSICFDDVFVVDSQMRLFSRISGLDPSRCLPSRRVAQVACGISHVLVLTTDGEVLGSGGNSNGQLGQGHRNHAIKLEMATVGVKGFATSVACGLVNSVVINCEGQAAFFGEWGEVWQSDAPAELESPVGPLVKAAGGYRHTLLLTAAGHLVGFGRSDRNQLGQLGDTATLKEIPFERAKGRPVDIFCHHELDASVVLTETDELYVCGDVGVLFNEELPVPQFRQYHKPAVMLEGLLVCMRPPTQRVMIPGFNERESCEIEVEPTDSAGQHDPPIGKQARLAPPSTCNHPPAAEVHETTPSVTEPSPSQPICISLHAIRARSRYLWAMLQSALTGDISQTEDRKKQLRLSKYSARVLEAYGRYLHEDVVVADAVGAIELSELAREYSDETGLAWQGAHAARRLVRETDLPLCLQRCIEIQKTALAVDLVKLRLSVENCCDVLEVVEMGSPEDPHVEYIRNIAVGFLLAHRQIVNTPQYEHMDNDIKARILTRVLKV